jgi:hypothetical protein
MVFNDKMPEYGYEFIPPEGTEPKNMLLLDKI